MFTGIINNLGVVRDISNNSLIIYSENKQFLNIDLGTSVSVDGVCLTLRNIQENNLEFQISNESKNRSIINGYKKNVNVNLELPTTVNEFLSGHIVQGHVDEISEVLNISEDNKNLWTFEFNSNNSKYLVDKGSVTINGVSLTVVNPNKHTFKVAVIDETYKRTNFQFLEANSQVNIEYDIISKYVERFIIDK
ncbi:MAG: riboflavin synthase [Candidatus Actinomarinales bacterium]|nr:MAG: riboflavin synthase [Candidatus Actinomarinales bacterium]